MSVSFSTVGMDSWPNLDFCAKRLDLAIVLPTFNERENVRELIFRLKDCLHGLCWEAIFVDDDSPDGTAEAIRRYAANDPRIRVLQRVGRRGLASACIEGMLATSARYVAVMDADLQHDETLLPRMLARLREDSLDIVVGTRKALGGSMGEFSRTRVALSGLGEKISHAVCRCRLSDPMSGFFMLDRGFFLEVVHGLQGTGFKILVDLLASSAREVRLAEIGYRFQARRAGESKLNANVGLQYLLLILNKISGGHIPVRFALFSLVGTLGIATHLACLAILTMRFHMHFIEAQIVSTYVAMTENFFLNNLVTYRDRSLKGEELIAGLLSFWLACSFGAWASVIFARALWQSGGAWYTAGLAGMVVSSVWNYSMSSLFTWQVTSKPLQEEGLRGPAAALASKLDLLR